MTQTPQRPTPRQLRANPVIIVRPDINNTVIRRPLFRESGPCIWVGVYVAVVPFFVGDVSFGRGDADPGPEGAGIGVVPWEVDLDGEVGGGWAGVEDGTCI